MGHDASKILLGSTKSNIKEVSSHVGALQAGVAVRLNASNALVTASSNAALLGISLGKDLSDTNKTAICRKGLLVPVLLTEGFTPAIGAQASFDNSTGFAATAGGGATATNAIYASGVLTGIKEDGTTANVALVDFQGGL
jgi:hypothetical protein